MKIMNRPETEKDPLDTLLREQNPYVEDDGFTARVLAHLPPHRPHFWLRQILLSGVTTIGFVLAVLRLPWKNLPMLDASALFSLNSQILLPWMLVFIVLASLVCGVFATIQWED
jgi:hypothetical protein